jgi:hypothetical protein
VSARGGYTGVHTATVEAVEDPKQPGSVVIRLADGRQHLARLATPFLPEVGDEVLVVFESGEARRPFVLGMLWHSDAPPETSGGVLRTRKGARVVVESGVVECETVVAAKVVSRT